MSCSTTFDGGTARQVGAGRAGRQFPPQFAPVLDACLGETARRYARVADVHEQPLGGVEERGLRGLSGGRVPGPGDCLLG